MRRRPEILVEMAAWHLGANLTLLSEMLVDKHRLWDSSDDVRRIERTGGSVC